MDPNQPEQATIVWLKKQQSWFCCCKRAWQSKKNPILSKPSLSSSSPFFDRDALIFLINNFQCTWSRRQQPSRRKTYITSLIFNNSSSNVMFVPIAKWKLDYQVAEPNSFLVFHITVVTSLETKPELDPHHQPIEIFFPFFVYVLEYES